MRKLLKTFFTLLAWGLLLFSCSDELDLNTEKGNKREEIENEKITPRVIFNSQAELQNFLDNLNADVMKLKAGNVENLLKNNPSVEICSPNGVEFISLLDSIRNKDLKDLTPEDWKEIYNDEEELVYIPEDSLIIDPAFASVLNYKRELQVNNTVYRYMEDGIYAVNESNAILLEDINENQTALKSSKALDSRITFYPASSLNHNEEEESSILKASNISLAGTSLTLDNGVVISANNIRDLNYKDRGDANWITNAWTSLWGKNIVAINKYNKKKKMLVTFYDQDYLIYKNIGTQAKMQKKKCWIWWNTHADEMRLGWEAIEFEETYSSPPFASAPKPSGVKPHQNFRPYEQKVPAWLSKDFPFRKKYTIFTLPVVNYDITSKHINQVYRAGLREVESTIKAKMKAENQKNTPTDIGIASLTQDNKMRFIIGKNEEVGYRKNHINKKFHSQWFSGTYVLGYSTDPNSPTASFKNSSFNIKGSKTKLKRGIVYGAVKYKGEWRAARIIKTE